MKTYNPEAPGSTPQGPKMANKKGLGSEPPPFACIVFFLLLASKGKLHPARPQPKASHQHSFRSKLASQAMDAAQTPSLSPASHQQSQASQPSPQACQPTCPPSHAQPRAKPAPAQAQAPKPKPANPTQPKPANPTPRTGAEPRTDGGRCRKPRTDVGRLRPVHRTAGSDRTAGRIGPAGSGGRFPPGRAPRFPPKTGPKSARAPFSLKKNIFLSLSLSPTRLSAFSVRPKPPRSRSSREASAQQKVMQHACLHGAMHATSNPCPAVPCTPACEHWTWGSSQHCKNRYYT